jgi:hypothetical protein
MAFVVGNGKNHGEREIKVKECKTVGALFRKGWQAFII